MEVGEITQLLSTWVRLVSVYHIRKKNRLKYKPMQRGWQTVNRKMAMTDGDRCYSKNDEGKN